MITIKTKKEIEIMREGGRRLAKVMEEIKKRVKPGVKTSELERVAKTLILKYGGECSFKGYKEGKNDPPYPACLCTCVNEEIVHVPPSDRVLKNGDILSLDLGMRYKGYHTDMALTLPVGEVDREVLRFIRVCKKALKRGIKKARVGNTFGDIGNTIQRFVESQGFNVVRDLCGHGIGKKLHEDPKILNYGKRREGEKIKEGMVFCIEPMITMGDWRIKKTKDGYGFQTKDGSLSCHFEHTIAITSSGPQILTEI